MGCSHCGMLTLGIAEARRDLRTAIRRAERYGTAEAVADLTRFQRAVQDRLTDQAYHLEHQHD